MLMVFKERTTQETLFITLQIEGAKLASANQIAPLPDQYFLNIRACDVRSKCNGLQNK